LFGKDVSQISFFENLTRYEILVVVLDFKIKAIKNVCILIME